MVVAANPAGTSGDSAEVVLKPEAFGWVERREESFADRVRSAEARQLAPGLVGGDDLTVGDQPADWGKVDDALLLRRQSPAALWAGSVFMTGPFPRGSPGGQP